MSEWWEQCRHRKREPQMIPGHQLEPGHGFSCKLAIKENRSSSRETAVGVEGCKEANCPYTDRLNVP